MAHSLEAFWGGEEEPIEAEPHLQGRRGEQMGWRYPGHPAVLILREV